MEIRLGTPEDTQALKEIDTTIESEPNRSSFIDEAIRQGTLRVAYNAGEILGYSVVNRSFFRRPTLEMLMVASQHRGTGVGRTLLRDARGLVGQGEELWTSTNESNTIMQSLLESHGFTRTGKIENLDPGDPELVYYHRVVET